MNSPILPVEGPLGLPSNTPSTSISERDLLIAELGEHLDAGGVQADHGYPPPEVVEAIVAADELAAQLRESGYVLRFYPSDDGEATRIELHDADGLVSELTTSQAMDLAAAPPAE